MNQTGSHLERFNIRAEEKVTEKPIRLVLILITTRDVGPAASL